MRKKMRQNLVGQKFGLLTVISFSHVDKHRFAIWECKCDCRIDKIIYTSTNSLKSGHTSSCGCQRVKNFTAKKHGMYKTKVYYTWNGMKQRCLNPKHEEYHNYGGRGITVCPEWLVFENFLRDMGVPEKTSTIDRINNDLGYFKENCRWTTTAVQNLNKQNNRKFSIDGKILTLKEICKLYNLEERLAYQRACNNWSIIDIINTPKRPRGGSH